MTILGFCKFFLELLGLAIDENYISSLSWGLQELVPSSSTYS